MNQHKSSSTFPLAAAILALAIATAFASRATADVRLPNLFTPHAVLQRDAPVPVWGWADPEERVTVSIAGQEHTTTADETGHWQVKLRPLSLGPPLMLTVAGKNQIVVDDILVGDVWLCSGQSNMQWPVSRSDSAAQEIATAELPNLRLLTVENPGSQTPQDNFLDRWKICTPSSVNDFSAVGFFFGRELNQVTGIPIGLIDNSWGGSRCEAWIRRDLLEGNPLYDPMLKRWDRRITNLEKAAASKNDSQATDDPRPKPQGGGQGNQRNRRRQALANNPATSQFRPANLYNARLRPIMPYAIRGVIWYQGEANVGRAPQYREMFPLMVRSWREEWGQGDFPFYWVQLPNFGPPPGDPTKDKWAALRDAQSAALEALPNVGQVVTIDVGAPNDKHPTNKQPVGDRLARIALANVYDRDIAHKNPRIDAVEFRDGAAIVRFTDVNGRVTAKDGKPVVGFALADADSPWKPATAEFTDAATLTVRSDEVRSPVALRYAWADDPDCNLFDSAGLPATPFQTSGPTASENAN